MFNDHYEEIKAEPKSLETYKKEGLKVLMGLCEKAQV